MRHTVASAAAVAALGGLLVLASSRAPRAEHSSYRETVTTRSIRAALGGVALPLLEVVPPEGGADEQLQRLARALGASRHPMLHLDGPGPVQRSRRSMFVQSMDRAWYLEVDGDGSTFRYRGDIDHLDPEGAPFGGPDTLERLGREFIVDDLASLVPMSADDALVFLGIRVLRDGSTTEIEPLISEVKARIALFGREVHGTFVGGRGSKVAVWFSGRGEVVGFDVDWPVYRTTERTQETLLIDGVIERFRSYGDSPLALLAENLKRFECGYVDLGVHKRGRAPIQTGCFAHHDGILPDDIRYASLDLVPIGVTVEVDPDWPVTAFIAEGRQWDICEALPRACVEPMAPGGINITIDIKPASDPNSIDLRSQGRVPVALIASEELSTDTEVDVPSLRFGRTGTEAAPLLCAPEDANNDGLLDLVCQFDVRQTGFQAGDTQGVLKGRTVRGGEFMAEDTVRILHR